MNANDQFISTSIRDFKQVHAKWHGNEILAKCKCIILIESINIKGLNFEGTKHN